MDLNKLMKQAQQMQAGMQKAQEDLATQSVEASVGGGKVVVVANGSGNIENITIDPSIIDPEDVEFLQELILQGVQDAISKSKEMATSEMSKFTGGMNIPGLS